MQTYTLQGVISIKYRLKLKTGLHIGGAKENFEIGGVDNPVIKLPLEVRLKDRTIPKDAPYVPGSSLKGKVRSLMEWFIREPKGVEGKTQTSVEYMTAKAKDNTKKLGAPCDCGTCSICKLFGVSDVKTLKEFIDKGEVDKLPGPPRVEFSDAYPTPESLEMLKETLGEGVYTEIKYENRINRLTGTVEQGGLRNQERVPAGVEFEGEITLDLYSEEDINLLEKLLTGLRLLENSYLGGSGSRGYGKVEFSQITLTLRDKNYFEKGSPEKELFRGALLELDENKTQEVLKKLKETLKGNGGT
ncbi:MAG: type III-A CRISPR-associated RAMP protein Csm3 [Gammaproteobacteria bacterium]|nr:MAG: type III-A CRISPR-associated RAMP protein Csm3 [Gammaproteobacteria bacterium]